MPLSRTDGLRQALTERVSVMPPGTRLPNERDLADEYHVHRETVRIALSTLVSRGLVTKEPRGGYWKADDTDDSIQYVEVTASQTDRHKNREQPAHYVVTLVAGEPVACTCAHFAYTRVQCKHQTRVISGASVNTVNNPKMRSNEQGWKDPREG